ncbi:metallophosphoesterase family protein [Bacillus sp. SB49]|uniref:metallophosphoesterase family protein n=1 Tax=Bacillus sp. SB49 TaxID=1071080 RepID=UPI000406E40A|nr:metallophosphoesterase family protein [Bacillus sp. SB49]QHT45420.1 metallophosphoesterase family protein [Bacillus sp. SB49]
MRKTIAVLADIHGNLEALEAVFADMEQHAYVTEIFCLGDLIGIGPHPNEVLACICARENVQVVSGNHEEAVLALIHGEAYPKRSETIRAHHEWVAASLDDAYIPWLTALPRQLTLEREGVNILLQHYHMKETRREFPIWRNPFEPVDYHPTARKLDDFYEEVEGSWDIVCFGHHHPVHLFQTEKRVYLNPGALGCYHKPLARYALIHLGEGQASVELREIPYDKGKVVEALYRLEVPKRDFIVQTFLSSKPPAAYVSSYGGNIEKG